MTYDEFIETINSLTIRRDAPISTFIRLAEVNLRPIARHYLGEKSVAIPVVSNAINLPSDFIELRALTGDKTYKPVAPMNTNLDENEVGYYREAAGINFVGEPDTSVQILYHAAFVNLTETDSNWLFDRFPTVYVAAVMREFHRWQKDAEGVGIEQAALNEALALVAEDDRKGRQTGTIIMGGGATWH